MSRELWIGAIAAVFAIGLSADAVAAVPGGGGRDRSRPSTSGPSRARVSPPGQGPADGPRVVATPQQRSQVQACDMTAQQVRQEARRMVQSARGNGSVSGDVLRDRVRAMDREHERLIGSLDERQRTQLRDRVERMTTARDRLHEQLHALDGAWVGDEPDYRRIRVTAREIDRAAKAWQKQVRRIEADVAS